MRSNRSSTGLVIGLAAIGLALVASVWRQRRNQGGVSPSQGKIPESSDELDFKAIDGYITARMRSARIPGLALGIVKDDQIVYLKGYGRADHPAAR
jgi:CubicO group peptidase (beta-lactamase class C family)